jgi:hypothetical protein
MLNDYGNEVNSLSRFAPRKEQRISSVEAAAQCIFTQTANGSHAKDKTYKKKTKLIV